MCSMCEFHTNGTRIHSREWTSKRGWSTESITNISLTSSDFTTHLLIDLSTTAWSLDLVDRSIASRLTYSRSHLDFPTSELELLSTKQSTNRCRSTVCSTVIRHLYKLALSRLNSSFDRPWTLDLDGLQPFGWFAGRPWTPDGPHHDISSPMFYFNIYILISLFILFSVVLFILFLFLYYLPLNLLAP